MGTPLKNPPPKNHGHSPLLLLETDRPQRAGSNSTKNRGILNNLRYSDREVGPDMTPSAGNIDTKPLLPHTPTNQTHGSLPLPIANHPQEERIDSLDNQGISSCQHSTENQGILNSSLQFRNNNLTMGNPPPKTPSSYKPWTQSSSSIKERPPTKSRERFHQKSRYFERFTKFG